MIYTALIKSSLCVMFVAYIDAAAVEMDYTHRFMAMGVGGIAALFALFFSPPKTNREAMIRFAAGCVVAFTCTGHTLNWLHMAVTPDSVMMIALIWGSISWSILGGMVRWGESGGAFSTLAKVVQGVLKQAKPVGDDEGNGSQEQTHVKQVKSIEDKKGE